MTILSNLKLLRLGCKDECAAFIQYVESFYQISNIWGALRARMITVTDVSLQLSAEFRAEAEKPAIVNRRDLELATPAAPRQVRVSGPVGRPQAAQQASECMRMIAVRTFVDCQRTTTLDRTVGHQGNTAHPYLSCCLGGSQPRIYRCGRARCRNKQRREGRRLRDRLVTSRSIMCSSTSKTRAHAPGHRVHKRCRGKGQDASRHIALKWFRHEARRIRCQLKWATSCGRYRGLVRDHHFLHGGFGSGLLLRTFITNKRRDRERHGASAAAAVYTGPRMPRLCVGAWHCHRVGVSAWGGCSHRFGYRLRG